MPELPEVETIKNNLSSFLPGRLIQQVKINTPEMVVTPDAEGLARGMTGARIRTVERRGKYLLLPLSRSGYFLLHLRMSGNLLLRRAGHAPDPYTRAVFSLDDGQELRFTDARKLGRMWLVKDPGEVVGKLGPEPLDAQLTPQDLQASLSGKRTPIKVLLCDQGFLAGVGNIYADETLFEAGIRPARPGHSLSPGEVKDLLAALRRVLVSAIGHGGTSFRDYRDAFGNMGEHWQYLGVPRTPGAPCRRCGTTIVRLVLRQRSAYFCPRCQK